MIFPIGDDNVKGGALPFFSYSLLAINIIAFVYTMADLEKHVTLYGANPCLIEQGLNLKSIFTSMFMHGGIGHLVGNMLFLWVFADNIESTIGNVRFILFYILGGFLAALVHVFVAGSEGCVPMIGASGAIAAVLGAYFVMFPRSRIKMLFFIKVFYLPAMIFLGFWIIQQVLSGISDIRIFGEPKEGGGVAFWAHIGGFMFGVIAGQYFKRKNPKIIEITDSNHHHEEYQSIKIPPRRYNNWH